MSIHLSIRTCLIASAVLLTSALVLAQATTTTEKKNATPTPPSATSRDSATGMATGRRQDQFPKASGARVDQFGHASGKQAAENIPPTPTTDVNPADVKSVGSAPATEAVTKKHIAGVKYADRTAAPTQPDQTGQPSAMAIKENGLPAKPTTKPKQ
jgi:hypothetical protein